jgi:Ni/Co efflux regulator RcnB
MKLSKWMFIGVMGSLLLVGSPALAQDHDHGNGHGKGHDKHEDDWDDHDEYRYRHHEQEIRGWYSERESNLPPGLAKKDRLPPGLEKQLVRNGTLPPGLQKRLYPAPVELERVLPPPPPDCAHVLVSGHIVLLNRKTNLIVDVFAF